MKVTELDERVIQDIGHAFGYYDYGPEHGLIDAFPGRDAAAAFICGYVRMALRGGILSTTSERGEGYLAYKRPGEKLSLRAMLPLAKGLLGSMTPKALFRFAKIMAEGEPGLDKRFDREKKPYLLSVWSACVSRIRDRAICGASWTWRFGRATGSVCRCSSKRTRSPSATSTSTPACSLPERAASASTARCTT